MWVIEIGRLMVFEQWIKIAVGVLAFIIGIFKIYDWVEKKIRRYSKLKKK